MAAIINIADFRRGENPKPQCNHGSRHKAVSRRPDRHRQERQAAWREADLKRRFCEAKHALALAARDLIAVAGSSEVKDDTLAHPFAAPDAVAFSLNEMLVATAAQLCTPAGDGLAIRWKQTRKYVRHLEGIGFEDHISIAEIDRFIQADEAWLKGGGAQ